MTFPMRGPITAGRAAAQADELPIEWSQLVCYVTVSDVADRITEPTDVHYRSDIRKEKDLADGELMTR